MPLKRSARSGDSAERKRAKNDASVVRERERLLWILQQDDAALELTTPGVVCQAKLFCDHVTIQTELAKSYRSLASKTAILCDWASTLRFDPQTTAGHGTDDDAPRMVSADGSALVDPEVVAAEIVTDKGEKKPMMEELLKKVRRRILDTCDKEACVQLLQLSDSPPKFIDTMILDPFWRSTLFDLVRKFRGEKHPFFEYVLTRISMLSDSVGFAVPAELCVDAESKIFQHKLRTEIEKVPQCASLAEFQSIRDILRAFNARFASHFFTVVLLTTKCGGRDELATRKMYEDPVKCLYFRLLQDVRRDALDRLVVESMMERYTDLCGLPQQIATLFILGSALRERTGRETSTRCRIDMGKVKELVDDEENRFDIALQIRQSGVLTDVLNMLCDPFEQDEKWLNIGNRDTLCRLCAIGSCLMEKDEEEANTRAYRLAAEKLIALSRIVLKTAEFTSDQKADAHGKLFERVRVLVLGREQASSPGAPELNASPLIAKAVLSWVRNLWLSEKHVRVNYTLFFLPFVELLHAMRCSPSITQIQIFEIADIYCQAFELQQSTRTMQSLHNTAHSRRLVLALELLDMMKDGVSRHVMEFLAAHAGSLDAGAQIKVLSTLCGMARPPFSEEFVSAFRTILRTSRAAISKQSPDDPNGIHRQLRAFAERAPKQLAFVADVLVECAVQSH